MTKKLSKDKKEEDKSGKKKKKRFKQFKAPEWPALTTLIIDEMNSSSKDYDTNEQKPMLEFKRNGANIGALVSRIVDYYFLCALGWRKEIPWFRKAEGVSLPGHEACTNP